MGVGATLLILGKAYAWAVTPSEPGGLRNGRGRNVADGGQGLRLGSDTQRTGGPEEWAAQRC